MNDPKPGGSSLLWLLVGLAPIPVLLAAFSSHRSSQTMGLVIFFVCLVCNFCGGFGCLGKIKDPLARSILGMLLGGVFFVLSWGIVLFQACSHMNI